MDKDISKKQEDINDFLTEKCKIENNDNDKISDVDNDLEEECDINDINTLNSEYTSDILNLNSSNNITTNIENEIKIKLKKSCVLYLEREIKILDKITTKVETFEIHVNDSINFNSLHIEVFACYKNPPEDIPENFVLLKIYDKIINSEDKAIYQGWMISSSPSTTPLEHPIYDLWLIKCK